MEYEQIIYEVEDQIAILTLNRPKRLNAWTWKMHEEFGDVLNRVERDTNVRALIVTGAGRGFCAAADLSRGEITFETDEPRKNKNRGEEYIFLSLKGYFSLKKPVITAINGPAVGVGIAMVLPFDIRIASESARNGIVFDRRGVVPDNTCTLILSRIIEISRAVELMYTGRVINAREALEFGLVSRFVPDEELMKVAKEIADQIALNAPVSVALTRRMLYQFLTESDIVKAEQINNQYFDWIGNQPDAREGVLSFFERRRPDWNLRVSGDLPSFFPLE